MSDHTEIRVRYGDLSIPVWPGSYRITFGVRSGTIVVSQENADAIKQNGGNGCNFWMICDRLDGDTQYSFEVGPITS